MTPNTSDAQMFIGQARTTSLGSHVQRGIHSSLLPLLPTLVTFYPVTYALNLGVIYDPTFSLPHSSYSVYYQLLLMLFIFFLSLSRLCIFLSFPTVTNVVQTLILSLESCTWWPAFKACPLILLIRSKSD